MAQTPIYNGESFAQGVPFTYDVTKHSTGVIPFALPSGLIPTVAEFNVETAFDGTAPTIKGGYTGTLAAFFDTTDVDLKNVTGTQIVPLRFTGPLSGNKELILTVVEDSSTVGIVHCLIRGFLMSPSIGR